jgi:3-hydroxyisobutyryl-CoA hydrolase
VEDIIKALDEDKQTSWTRETRHKLLAMSPTSLRVTLKALRKSKDMSLTECLKMEFDLMQKFLVSQTQKDEEGNKNTHYPKFG